MEITQKVDAAMGVAASSGWEAAAGRARTPLALDFTTLWVAVNAAAAPRGGLYCSSKFMHQLTVAGRKSRQPQDVAYDHPR